MPAARPRGGEGLIDASDVVFSQPEVPGTCILLDVIHTPRFWNREHAGVADEKPQRHLPGRGPAGARDLLQHGVAAKAALSKRARSDDRDVVAFADRKNVVLDGSFLQMVEDLVAGDAVRPPDAHGFCDAVLVKIGDTPGLYFAIPDQLFKRRDRVGETMPAGPVDQVAIKVLCAQAAPAALTSGYPYSSVGRVPADLSDIEHTLTTVSDVLPH